MTNIQNRNKNQATKVIIPCRISFANIWEPRSINGSEEKYSVSCIIPKDDKKTIARIQSAVEAAKELIISTDIPHIVNRGRKGGSNVAAAICNAVLYAMKD